MAAILTPRVRRTLRRLHLYLGCVFAPLLLFFAISGGFQTFQFHVDLKNGYKAPAMLKTIGEVHRNQRIDDFDGEAIPSSVPFRYGMLAMSLGLVVTVCLGILMAFQAAANQRVVWLCLILGAIVPLGLLWLG